MPYDYVSVMHFEGNEYSENNQTTISAYTNGNEHISLGTGNGLPTEYDFLHIYLLYCEGNCIEVKNNIEVVELYYYNHVYLTGEIFP